MSISRAGAIGASFVCSVESTRCPVSADSIAVWAVSRSRISPTISTSGSLRSIERRPRTNVTPAAGFTCTCLTPSSSYSTGSSIVISVLSGVLISLRAAYRVVVLPAPVGPVTSTAPRSCLIECSSSSGPPSPSRAGRGRDHALLVEDAHHHRLPAHQGQRRDADVDVVFVDLEADAAVLGGPALGDIELGHDLDPGDEAGGEAPAAPWRSRRRRRRPGSGPACRRPEGRSGCRRRRERPRRRSPSGRASRPAPPRPMRAARSPGRRRRPSSVSSSTSCTDSSRLESWLITASMSSGDATAS